MTRPPLVFELQVYLSLYSGLNEEQWKKATDQSVYFLLSGAARRGLNRETNFDAGILDISVCAMWGFKTGNRYWVV